MKGKLVIVAVNISNSMVFAEFKKEVDARVGEFGLQIEALMDILSGKTEPSALLPLRMPINMSTVEKQMEDVPHDPIPNKDNNGNSYNFGFGLNWDGGIKDSGTSKSKVDKTKFIAIYYHRDLLAEGFLYIKLGGLNSYESF